ncbi:hypothetical protein ABZ070_13320 [Streptomyces sp. NPDC006283]|uniref:hypothetical protein n=1 Tax=Streptomyces sp. NPDC006283 TaxID=3156741 RepID=UPI0033A92DBA
MHDLLRLEDEDSWADLAVSGVTTGARPVVSGDWDGTGQDGLVIGETGVGSPPGGGITLYVAAATCPASSRSRCGTGLRI